MNVQWKDTYGFAWILSIFFPFSQSLLRVFRGRGNANCLLLQQNLGQTGFTSPTPGTLTAWWNCIYLFTYVRCQCGVMTVWFLYNYFCREHLGKSEREVRDSTFMDFFCLFCFVIMASSFIRFYNKCGGCTKWSKQKNNNSRTLEALVLRSFKHIYFRGN